MENNIFTFAMQTRGIISASDEIFSKLYSSENIIKYKELNPDSYFIEAIFVSFRDSVKFQDEDYILANWTEIPVNLIKENAGKFVEAPIHWLHYGEKFPIGNVATASFSEKHNGIYGLILIHGTEDGKTLKKLLAGNILAKNMSPIKDMSMSISFKGGEGIISETNTLITEFNVIGVDIVRKGRAAIKGSEITNTHFSEDSNMTASLKEQILKLSKEELKQYSNIKVFIDEEIAKAKSDVVDARVSILANIKKIESIENFTNLCGKKMAYLYNMAINSDNEAIIEMSINEVNEIDYAIKNEGGNVETETKTAKEEEADDSEGNPLSANINFEEMI